MICLLANVDSGTDTAQSIKLRDAIKEYEANKWKVIGQKVGKPAKVSCDSHIHRRSSTDFHQACEQYAKEHFKNL